MKDFFAWVHTCPLRDGSDLLKGTIDSVWASDARDDFEVWRHPDGLTSPQITSWWHERLLESATRGEVIVRLEDDTDVSAHLKHNVLTWEALKEPDFLCGTLFTWDFLPVQKMCERNERGLPYLRVGLYGAQGLVFRADRMALVVENIKKNSGRQMYHLDFDEVFFRAAYELGMRVYVHEQSLVNGLPGNEKSAVHNGIFHPAGFYSHATFDKHWKRP
jgi:hypothetical protein